MATMRTIVIAMVLFALLNGSPSSSQTPTVLCSSFQNWQDYYSTWYEMYPTYAYQNMYPFGSTFCDANATSGGKSIGFNPVTTPASALYSFPFAGTTYHSMWVSPNGYILLNETVNFQTPSFSYMQLEWPNQNYPINGAVDPPFFSPFYAYINYRTGQQYEPSQISYRILSPMAAGTSAAQQNIQTGMLNLLSKDVRASTLGSMWFSATWGIVVTYYNVTFYTNNPCTTGPNLQDTCMRNTFQVALVTDGMTSYSIYNYFNITWVGSQALQNCDPNTGQNSTAYPNCQPAQIGFNTGFGRGFVSLPYAGTPQEVNMDSLSGTNITGRWVYQVSGDVIHHGGCTNDSSLGATGTWPLTITPLFGPMFGGNVVNVSGPCFLNGLSIKCRFGSVVSTAYNWGDMMQVMCVQPMLYEVGPITLSVSIDGGANYYFSTTYTVIQQERVPELGVQVVNTNNNWLTPTTISLTWNSLNLSSEWGNVVTIQLLGYESLSWQIIYTFVFEAPNTGTYTFTYNNQMCYNQNNHQVCSKYSLGAFRVSLSNWQWDPYNPIAMWSAPVPLAWFMKDQVQYDQGWYWSHDQCQNWYTQDSQNTNWHNYLPACPCNLNQSYVDFGRFVQTTDCNQLNYNKPGGCPRNQGALACFESTNVTMSGSSTRCCYNSYGNLMYTGDAVNGSISQRSDPWGFYPYNTSPNIPSISNWENDLLPYYYCCIWQTNNYDCFSLYMNARPTQDCKNYNPPGHATAFGDPHFVTMDGTLYTFNGWGEFWLLDISNAQVAGGSVTFALQGRFQQPLNQTWGQIKATVMTAVAMQLNGGTIVTVMTNLYSQKERMLVYVNSTLLNFTAPSQWWQQYPEFMVMNSDTTGTYSNFTIIWRIGIGVNIGWATGVMEMYATIPPEFMRVTGGLFGYWNGNPQDDLMPRGSTSTPISPTDSQSLYTSFGMTWIVQPQETIFTYAYRASLNYNYYRNTWFQPTFVAAIPPNGTVTQAQVNAVCYSDTSCQYDYMITENQSVAVDTHAVTMWDAQLRSMGPFVTSCGWLNIPDSVRQEPICYLVGCQVTILGCMSGFKMYSSTGNWQRSYTCQSTGYQTATWTPAITITCNWLDYKLPPGIQAAIAVPLCIFAAIGIIATIFCLCRWHRRRKAVRKERREKRRGDSSSAASTTNLVPPAPPATTAIAAPMVASSYNAAPNRQGSYNNVVVTGTLSDSYLDRASRSSTPSKMSVGTAVSNATNGRAGQPVPAAPGGVVLSVNQLPQSSRPHTPSQGPPASRPITPAQSGPYRGVAVTYNPNPYGAPGGSVTIQGQRGASPGPGGQQRVQPPSPTPYQYQTTGQNVTPRPNDYYSRRYAPAPLAPNGNDSEV